MTLRGYDEWKLRTPEDEQHGPPPEQDEPTTEPCPMCTDRDPEDVERDHRACDERCVRYCKGHCRVCGGEREVPL